VVGSTAPVLATGSGTLAVLAAAVVCSELLDVGTLVLCGPGHEDHDLVTATRSLLECVSLGLTWTA
jgi:hypothetical protein